MKPWLSPECLVGGVLVFALHAAALWGLLSHRLIALPASTPTLFVDLIAPPAPAVPRPVLIPVPVAPAEPRPPRSEPLRPSQGISSAAAPAPGAAVVPVPPPAPAIAVAPAPTLALASGPVTLTRELAVSCPERSAPDYPLASRRRNEAGTTLLHVELDENGQVAATSILSSSGSARLDDAALTAVKNWRCVPAQRNGQAVRAIARQAFNFVLQGK